MDKFALQLLRVELLFGDVGPDVALGVVLVELVKCTNLNKSKIEQNMELSYSISEKSEKYLEKKFVAVPLLRLVVER